MSANILSGGCDRTLYLTSEFGERGPTAGCVMKAQVKPHGQIKSACLKHGRCISDMNESLPCRHIVLRSSASVLHEKLSKEGIRAMVSPVLRRRN
jgi:hypothetical protein